MAAKICAHPVNIADLKKHVSQWAISRPIQQEVLQFVSDLELGKVNKGKRISERRQAKYLGLLKVVLEYLNKPTRKLTPKDIERFEHDLHADLIQSRFKRTPYSLATKSDLRKALIVYLRWRLGKEKAMHLAGWLDTRVPATTPDYLKEQEVEQLYRRCATPEQRYIVAFLFDSGARAEEFINVRYEDIHLPEGKENYVKVTLREEYSKSKGRTISLYWRHSLEAVTEYLKQRVAERIGPKDPVFDNTYDAMRLAVHRLGKKVLKKRVHPHLFRHSSATYYATKLNRQELCYRYGWKFSSNMPDIYISRAGMETKDLDVKFTKTEIGDLKDDLSKLQQETKIKDDHIQRLEGTIQDMQRNISAITEILALKPTVQEVEAALKRKKMQIAKAS